jgi:hypothetical protein
MPGGTPTRAFAKSLACKRFELTPAAGGGKKDFVVWFVDWADQPHHKPLIDSK